MMSWTHPLVNADEIRQSIQESLDALPHRPSDEDWKWWMATDVNANRKVTHVGPLC